MAATIPCIIVGLLLVVAVIAVFVVQRKRAKTAQKNLCQKMDGIDETLVGDDTFRFAFSTILAAAFLSVVIWPC